MSSLYLFQFAALVFMLVNALFVAHPINLGD